jgi:methionyl-tRNA synthetase
VKELKNTYYITTPIYYPSGQAHLGHSYSTVAADVMARYKRMQGFDVMFLTGTDEHGQKIELNAQKAGLSPKDYIDPIVDNFKKLWKLLGISYDKFIRTTDGYHKRAVQKIFDDLYKKKEIYKGKYSGWYCTPCESFFTDVQAKGGKCPDCGREVRREEEESYFFKLSEYSEKLLKFYDDNPNFIQPESRKNEMIKFIKEGLDDLCVSRTSFKWGIPVNFDKDHVVYVWLDALTNYITAQGYGSEDSGDYKKYWPADVHFVGKEIVRFHAVIWPAILMALELPLPKRIFGHGWLLFGDGGKMSKSKGNVIDPNILCGRYSVDAVRYFLMREIPFGSDGIFVNESLIKRINFDLANDLGNLLSRSTAMVEKYFESCILENSEFSNIDNDLINMAKSLQSEYQKSMDNFHFSSALDKIWLLISKSNKYIDENMPWKLAKEEKSKPRLSTVLYNLCECLRIISILISPFMPDTSKKIQNQLGTSKDICGWETASKWGLMPLGFKVKKGEPLFPRIDIEKEIEDLNKIIENKSEDSNDTTAELIDIEDFGKIDLKVVKVENCEHIKRSKKLLKLTVNDGKAIRTIVSGISDYYAPEELIGKHVVIVSNLKSAKLCGIESQGMILAADCGENEVKAIFANEIPAGSKIR